MEKESLLELRKKLDRLSIEEQKKRSGYLRGLATGEIQGPLTGHASIDRVWLKHYNPQAEADVLDSPSDKTIWDVIEEKLIEYKDIPAMDYFGTEISRPEFRELCYTWAKTFKAMGVQEGEMVPVYGPFVPDICAMTFALIMIGAYPYFLKLAINPQALEEECRDSKIAVVYDGMWNNVSCEFTKEKYKKVIVASVDQYMPTPKKQIVSLATKMKAIKEKSRIPRDNKYIWLDDARKIAQYYAGPVKVPFKPNRNTFITSSSGTTVGGVVKGTVATNETAISQLYMSKASDAQFYVGDRCLNHFPPTASTSLNLLFLTPLFLGETVLVDPRVSEKDFYNQITQLKPNQALNTGSAWEAFFNRVEAEMKQGKKFDFSYAKGWSVGGEGTDEKKMNKWNEIMAKAGAPHGMLSGYGSSELFSVSTAAKPEIKTKSSKQILSVGVPYAGMTMGVFDENGAELLYNQRGELRIKSKSAMKEYYNKPELTAKVKQDGWICTGDLAEIDEDGFVFIWGRVKENIELENGEKVYLFDIANKLKQNEFIDDAIVLNMPTVDDKNNLVAHIVWSDYVSESEKKDCIEKMNRDMSEYLPEGLKVSAYSAHDVMLPYSPTTLKKDKNRLAKQTTDYVQIVDGEMSKVEFIPNMDGEYTTQIEPVISNNRHR